MMIPNAAPAWSAALVALVALLQGPALIERGPPHPSLPEWRGAKKGPRRGPEFRETE